MIAKTYNVRTLVSQIAQAEREGDKDKTTALIIRLRRITKPLRDLCNSEVEI